ncbi:MAG TPA: hypothetical protein VGK67_12525 [Myxococcales bacterium]|jgi:tetratricopeptide (TPR) repeat protein
MSTSNADERAVSTSLDEQWARRDDPEVVERSEKLLEESLARSPASVPILWRAGRLHFWRADVSDDLRTRQAMSQRGWGEAEKAVALDPDCPDAHYWAAAACGTYAEAIGVLNALSKGLDARLRRNLDWAVQRVPAYEWGGPLLTLGRYWAQLPWPKRDRKKALESLRAAVSGHPENLRAKLYLAEVLQAEGSGAARREARVHLERILGAAPGRYDAPEERLIQRRARALRGQLEKER